MTYRDYVRQKNLETLQLVELSHLVDDISNEVIKIWNRQPEGSQTNIYNDIILSAFSKSILSMRAIISLATDGYPDAALSIARNLYEQAILLTYFEQLPDEETRYSHIHDYYTEYNIHWHKLQKDLAESDEERDIVNETIRQLKESNEHYEKNKKYWWAGVKTFYDLEICVSESVDEPLKKIYRLMHKMYVEASITLHASHLGNAHGLGKTNNNYDSNPRTAGIEKPLWFATESLRIVTTITYKNILCSSNKYEDSLIRFAIKYLEPYCHPSAE